MELENTADQLGNFLKFLDDVQSCYDFCMDGMQEEDKLSQDLLHSLELDELNSNEVGRLTTKLKRNRRDRRYYKDRVQVYEPIINYLNNAQNKTAINKLKEVLGQVKKQESYMKYRTYIPKSIKEERKQNHEDQET